MGEEVVAEGLTLRPVARVVDLDDPHRPGHADDYPNIDQKPFQRLAALEGAVDQHSVHPDAVADQQRRIGHDEKQSEGGP